MTFIDIFTWIVLLIIVVTVVGVFVFMGLWPGKVASQNNHPQAEAIKIGSWVALIMGFALWPVVLVWAYTKPAGSQPVAEQSAESAVELKEKVEVLETRISKLESTGPKVSQGGAS